MRKCLNKHNYLFCSLAVGYKTYEKRFYCSLYIPLVSPLFFFDMKITLSTFISIPCLLNNAMNIHVKFVLRISRNKLLFSLLWLVRLYRTVHQSFSRGNAGLNDILNIFQQQRDQSVPKVIYI